VLLVQVVKEERGNKGAALTTYLSLAGRYCVLMPNTSHGGGISRKISNGADRKRLKAIMADLNLPSTMGCIVRTAGLSRTKTEIKRDFDYLARLWDEIREKTLKSSAPALIYGDSDLIKRAIRDIYNRDIEDVVVEGEEGCRAAKAFMKLLMPSHVKRVKSYADPVPLFQRYGVEDQLAGMYQPIVQLKSGGYLVINPTEALVSIDINSGRATREHNIEQTAYATNVEAAHEIARQLRLRDMAGLVVIDFIDMESNGHIRKVEKAMKEALKNDRARIQVGRISSFGLMEMSRQRLRTGVLEASTKPCPHCEGTGLMRTASSAGLSALRMLEDEAARGRGSRIILRAGREAAVDVLNKKRSEIAEVEHRYGVEVEILIDEALEGARMNVESLGPPPVARPRVEQAPLVDEEEDVLPEVEEEDVEAEEEEEEAEEMRAEPRREGEAGERARKRRRRRGRRGGRRRGPDEGQELEAQEETADELVPAEAAEELVEAAAPVEVEAEAGEAAAEDPQPRKGRRRRGRRDTVEVDIVPEGTPEERIVVEAETPQEEAEAPKPKRRRSRAKAAEPEAVEAEAVEAEAPEVATPEPANDENGPRPPRRRAKRGGNGAKEAAPETQETVVPSGPEAEEPGAEDDDTPRRGWWQRTFGP
jgi:ribonuclease E